MNGLGTCRVTFDGTTVEVGAQQVVTIGREGDLPLGENPYLHRSFLELREIEGLWWLVNVGSRLAATITDGDGGVAATLSPGGRIPMLFDRVTIFFTAGAEAYTITVESASPVFRPVPRSAPAHGATTFGAVVLTTSQRALIVALAEPLLRREGAGVSEIPSSARAAATLGWTQSRFNRKLDNVCDKFDATHLVTAADRSLLDTAEIIEDAE